MKKNFLLALLGLIILLPISSAHALIAGGCGASCYTGHNSYNYLGDPYINESTIYSTYLMRQAIIVISFYVTGFFCGRAVQRGKISASISRKIVCITTFLFSFANSVIFSNVQSGAWVEFMILGLLCLLLILASLIWPLRQKITFLNVVFTSINRPEDAPHTLKWLTTEAITTTVIIICFGIYFEGALGYGGSQYENIVFRKITNSILFSGLLLIPVFASGLGDAMAEIVGKKWGRIHYRTFAIFTKKKYSRTLEGSAAMFITTLLCGLGIVGYMHLAVSHLPHYYNHEQALSIPKFFWEAVILLPVTMTLAEALSPHTWDNPFLYLSGYITILFCIAL